MSEAVTCRKVIHHGRLYYLLDDGITCISTFNGFAFKLDVWPEAMPSPARLPGDAQGGA